MISNLYHFVKKAFYLALIVSLYQDTGYAQRSSKAILMSEMQAIPENVDFDISEYLYKLGMKTAANFDDYPNGLIAVRVCSPELLPIALVYGSTNPLSTTERFRELTNSFRVNLPPDAKTEIYFLRSNKNCKLSEQFTVQYWFVPEDADFPEFVEHKKMDDIYINDLIYEILQLDDSELKFPFKADKMLLDAEDDVEVNPEIFETAKKKIAELLIQNKTAYLLIKMPDTLRQQRIINPRAAALKTFLNKQGIGNHRIFVRKCSWCFNNTYNSKSKDLYPEISIIYQR